MIVITDANCTRDGCNLGYGLTRRTFVSKHRSTAHAVEPLGNESCHTRGLRRACGNDPPGGQQGLRGASTGFASAACGAAPGEAERDAPATLCSEATRRNSQDQAAKVRNPEGRNPENRKGKDRAAQNRTTKD